MIALKSFVAEQMYMLRKKFEVKKFEEKQILSNNENKLLDQIELLKNEK